MSAWANGTGRRPRRRRPRPRPPRAAPRSTTSGSSVGGRRQGGDVEATTEHARGREHAARVVGQEFDPAADGRADVAGECRVRHQGSHDRTDDGLGIRLGSRGRGTSENGRLAGGTAGVLAARATRGGRSRQGPLDLGAPKHRALLALLLLEPGPRRLGRPADRPALARRAARRRDLDPPGLRLEPAAGARARIAPPGAPATILVTRPPGYVARHRAGTGRCGPLRAQRDLRDRSARARPARRRRGLPRRRARAVARPAARRRRRTSRGPSPSANA